jgi:SAM-dependent methyltransferase
VTVGDGDTAQRSLAHWSEAGRGGMEAFYELAVEDYRQLAAAVDWPAALRAVAGPDGRVRLLDVACGSGKFPTALLRAGLAERAGDLRVETDLLDPSAFSLAEARSVLAPPFAAVADHQVGLQDFDPAAGPYDVAWATHALYALPPEQLAAGLSRMAAALRPGGLGMVAQAAAASHYLAFYEAYRATVDHPVTPFTTAEQVVDALRGLGLAPAVRTLRYRTGSADRAVVEGFLQRCAFDGSLPLAAMESRGPLAGYLAGCRDGGAYTFAHQVELITWTGR